MDLGEGWPQGGGWSQNLALKSDPNPCLQLSWPNPDCSDLHQQLCCTDPSSPTGVTLLAASKGNNLTLTLSQAAVNLKLALDTVPAGLPACFGAD